MPTRWERNYGVDCKPYPNSERKTEDYQTYSKRLMKRRIEKQKRSHFEVAEEILSFRFEVILRFRIDVMQRLVLLNVDHYFQYWKNESCIKKSIRGNKSHR